jgi:phage gpG-like protein
MAAAGVSMDLRGMKKLGLWVKSMTTFTRDMSPYFEAAVPALKERVEQTFDDEGPGWQPLAPSTIAARVRAGYGSGPILQQTGALRRSATDDAEVNISRRGMTYRTTLPYAKTHQEGAGRIPRRSFINMEQLTPVLVDEFGMAFRKRFLSTFRANFGGGR